MTAQEPTEKKAGKFCFSSPQTEASISLLTSCYACVKAISLGKEISNYKYYAHSKASIGIFIRYIVSYSLWNISSYAVFLSKDVHNCIWLVRVIFHLIAIFPLPNSPSESLTWLYPIKKVMKVLLWTAFFFDLLSPMTKFSISNYIFYFDWKDTYRRQP